MAGKGKGCLLQAKTRLELKDSRRPRGDATLQGVHGTTIRGLDTTERDSESRGETIPGPRHGAGNGVQKRREGRRRGCWGFMID